MNWRKEYEREKERRDSLRTKVTQLETERLRYRGALEDLAERLGVHENYVHEFPHDNYVRSSSGTWVLEITRAFDVGLFVGDLAEMKNVTGAEKRLTPIKNKEKKESK